MRKRYILIWGVIALLPVAIFAMVEGVLFYRELHHSSRLQFRQVAHSTLYAVDQTVLGLSSALTALSTLPELDRGEAGAFVSHARALMAAYPEWREIVLTSPGTGNVRQRVRRGGDESTNGAAPAVPTLPLGTDPYVSNVITPAEGEGSPYILIAVAVSAADGSPAGVLSGTIAADTIAQGLIAQDLPDDWGVRLLDRNFRKIAESGNSAMADLNQPLGSSSVGNVFNPPKVFRTVTTNGEPRSIYIARSRSSLTGWELVLSAPEEPLLEMADQTRLILIVAGTVAILATVVLAYSVFALIRRTEAKEQEAIQKDALLREVNHRVKNSLQMVASILRLQQSKTEEPEARQHLVEAGSRINLIAKVHSQLYRDREPDCIEISRFLKDLCTDIQRGWTAGERPVLHCKAETALYIPTERATSLIMIAHELVSNAFKYAEETDPLEVTVSLRQDGDDLVLEVSDTGPGLPPEFDPQTHAGLGYRIVNSLLGQLHGTVSITRRGNPTAITVRVPLGGLAG